MIARVFEHAFLDIRHAARQLMAAPFFTLVSAASLGLAIAVAVTAYSLINSLIFKPLPVRDADRIVHVFASRSTQEFGGSVYDDLDAYRSSGVFQDVVGYFESGAIVAANHHDPAQLQVGYVTPDYFSVIGLRLDEGRSFTAGGGAPEIVISDQYRRRTFKPHEQVIGATVTIANLPFTVVGVTPRAFRGLYVGGSPPAGWIPAQQLPYVWHGNRSAFDRDRRYWAVAGRLAPGIAPAIATQRLSALARDLADLYPKQWRENGKPLKLYVLTHHDYTIQSAAAYLADALIALGVLVSMVLILACTNVAGLLLARAVSRRHEVAVRLTLGAQRSRIASQFMTEALMLSLLGGFLGFLAAEWIMAVVGRNPLFESFDLTPDWRIFASTLVTCVLCAIAFGVTPLGHTLRQNINAGLSGPGMVGERGGVRGRLIALQVCVSCLLVVLGMHASRGVQAKTRTSPGFRMDGLLVANLESFGGFSDDSVARQKYIRDAEEILHSIPAVIRTTRTISIPIAGMDVFNGAAQLADGTVMDVKTLTVDPEYFPTLGVQTLQGTLPRASDISPLRRVAVVNRTMTQRAGRNLIGTTLRMGLNNEVVVVGEVDDLDRVGPTERKARVYEVKPLPTASWYRTYIIARVTRGGEPSVTAALARGMRERYPDRVPPTVNTLRTLVDASVAPVRYIARAASAFGMIELALAGIGLYSLLLYAMLTRTREVGVRMALGARPARASYAIMKDGLLFVLAGLVLGGFAAIPAGIIAGRNFMGADVHDPVPYAVAFGGIIVATIAATFVPARKAARVQPSVALRHE